MLLTLLPALPELFIFNLLALWLLFEWLQQSSELLIFPQFFISVCFSLGLAALVAGVAFLSLDFSALFISVLALLFLTGF